MSAVGGIDQFQARLQGLASAIRAELAQEIQTQAASLADRARALAGGALGDSITAEPDGLQAEIGSDLPYARLTELGFQGSESVKAYLREIRQVFGRPVTPHPIAVGAFQRTVDRPGRPYLDPALAAAGLPDGLVAAIGRAIGS
ncbi:MAG: hypothetical protein JWO51_2447 [Rhodospirillales bacterium]|nr:hypothetical protein [Rhodospirillales bacterium]